MAAETDWHRYGIKLHHCHPMYNCHISLGARHLSGGGAPFSPAPLEPSRAKWFVVPAAVWR